MYCKDHENVFPKIDLPDSTGNHKSNDPIDDFSQVKRNQYSPFVLTRYVELISFCPNAWRASRWGRSCSDPFHPAL